MNQFDAIVEAGDSGPVASFNGVRITLPRLKELAGGVAGSPWIGLEHFQTLFGSDQFLRALKNTIIISFLRPALRLFNADIPGADVQ